MSRQVVGFYPMRISVADSLITVECTHKTESHLTGTIVDEQNLPVGYATVALLNPADSTLLGGGVSNEAGYFAIPYEAGSVLVRISCLGYKTVFQIFDQPDAGTICLQTDNYILDGVTVKASRPQYKMGGEGLVAMIENTVLSKIGTGEDVLTHIPGIVKKDGGFEVFGRGTPMIYINGKKMQDLSELDRLSSTDIQSVELVTDPGAAYDATVGAVIKIKTHKKQGDGLGITYRQVYSQAHQYGLQEQLDINYRYQNFDLFGSLYYGLSHGRQEQRNDQTVNGVRTLELVEDLVIQSRDENFKDSFGFNYDVNDNHSFGATYTGNIPTYSKAGWVTNMDVIRNGSKADRLLNVFDYTGMKRPTHDIAAYYNGNIGAVGIEWNGNAYFRKNGNEQTSQESGEAAGDERLVTTHYSADSKLLASKLVLTIPLWKGNLQVGNEYTNIDRRNIYQIEAAGENLPESSDDKIKESNMAAFASYSFNLNKVKVDGGLRYEHVISDYYDHEIHVAEQSRIYDNLFPHLSLSFPVKEVSGRLSYNIKTRRPSYSILSSNVQYNDRFTYQRGNPIVQPSYLHTAAMTLSWRWVRFYANWRYIKDGFYQFVEPYEKDDEITVFSYRNHPHYQTVSSGITLSPKIGCWSPMLDVSMLYQDFSDNGRTYNMPIFFMKFNNSFQLPHDFIANVDMDFTSRGHSAIIEWEASGGLNIGLYKGFFNDRLSVNLQGKDLFASYRNSSWLRYGNREIYKWNYADTRKLVLTIRYKFNTTRSKYKGTGAGNDEKSRL